MTATDSFAALLGQLKTAENEAARAVFVRYTHRLVGLARRHLDGRLAVKVDPEDVVQSAYKSFFVRQRDGDFEIGSWDGLWGLLAVITLRKCARRAEYYAAEKRAVSREVPPPTTPTPAAWQLAVDRDPSPEEATELAETVEGLFRALDDADERVVLELSLQGYTAAEIGEQTGRAERSVRRLRERTRKRLERMQADD